MDSYLPFLPHFVNTKLNNKLATSSQFLPYLVTPPPPMKIGTTQSPSRDSSFFLGWGWCGLKFGVFGSSSFLKAQMKENSISRKLGVRFYCCCCCEISRAPLSLRGAVSFLLCFIWFLWDEDSVFARFFFSLERLVKRERERERERERGRSF
jgi:hypothetical protein